MQADNKPYGFQLINGTHIIARVSEVGEGEAEGTVVLSDIREIAIVPHPQSRQPTPTLVGYGTCYGMFPAIESEAFALLHILHGWRVLPEAIESAYVKSVSKIELVSSMPKGL